MRSAGILVLSCSLISSALVLSLFAATPQHSGRKTYLGFDENDYPGDDELPVLRKTFSFASYWIGPPPEEKSSSWLGKRGLLERQGFGFVVLWNGPNSRELKSSAEAQQKGDADVHAAAAVARQEGFPASTVIFLDIEEGGRLSAAYHDYLHAWIDGLNREKFQPGVYCSSMPVNEPHGVTITTAKNIEDQLAGRKLVFWIFNDACPPSPGCTFPATPPSPEEGGFGPAAVWQYAQSPRRKQFTANCSSSYARDGN